MNNTMTTLPRPTQQTLQEIISTINLLAPHARKEIIHVSGHKINGQYFNGELVDVDMPKGIIEVVEDADSTFINITDLRSFHHSNLNRTTVVQ